MRAKRIAATAALTALALIAFAIENLFPPLFVPGARLGIGNVFIFIILIYIGFPEAIIASVAKSLIAGIFGGASTVLYSLPAGIASVICAFLLLNAGGKISVVAASSAAATIHNLVQNTVFAAVTESLAVMVYAPYLAAIGAACGVVTGVIVFAINRAIGARIDKMLGSAKKTGGKGG